MYFPQYLDSILKNLTPDDIRCLLISEDELARSAPLERIFPSSTSHKYLRFIENPRYYNRLMDAWEHKYGVSEHSRDEGIALLRKFCENKTHLCVPPQPVKKVIFFYFNLCIHQFSLYHLNFCFLLFFTLYYNTCSQRFLFSSSKKKK